MDNDAGILLMGTAALDRYAYRLLLKAELDLEISAECDFSPLSVWAALRTGPTLAIVLADHLLSEARDAVQMMVRSRPSTRVLVVSEVVDPQVLQSWGRCRIIGYVFKHGGLSELRRAIEEVLEGGVYFSDGVAEIIERSRVKDATKPKLSRRETELLPLLARGMTLREAASQMSVSYKTADSYRTSLLKKLDVRGRVELARYAIRERIIDP